jgi:hypothetical protein
VWQLLPCQWSPGLESASFPILENNENVSYSNEEKLKKKLERANMLRTREAFHPTLDFTEIS